MWRFGLGIGSVVSQRVSEGIYRGWVNAHTPCKAGDAVPGDSANVSRSLRRAEDCLSAALKRGFYIGLIKEILQVAELYRHYHCERLGLEQSNWGQEIFKCRLQEAGMRPWVA